MVKVLALNFKNLPVRRLGLFQSTRNEIVREVNGLHSSKDRVLKFHQITKNNKPFIIVDKAQSIAMLYSQGQLQKTVPVGVGRTGGVGQAMPDLQTEHYIKEGKQIKKKD